MKVLALVSGGKDSCFSAMLCKRHGHEIIALGNLAPDPSILLDDLDSWMFQTVGHSVVESYAQCTCLPLFKACTRGQATTTSLAYTPQESDEVEDLFNLVHSVRQHFPDLQGVCSGAIASDYQRLRVENVCSRLGLISLAPLWRRPQTTVLQEMIDNEIEAVLVKVAALGLVPEKHLGQNLKAMQPHLTSLRTQYGCNICGEGGEYETLVLDCPLFTSGRISIERSLIRKGLDSGDIAPSAVLDIESFHVIPKEGIPQRSPVIHIVPSTMDGRLDTLARPRHPSGDKLAIEKKQVATRHFFWMHLQGTASSDAPSKTEETQASLSVMLQALEDALRGNGMAFTDIIFVQFILNDMRHFSAANEIYKQFFPSVNPPSRACIELEISVPCRIEILAARSHSTLSIPRRVLHVQSVSSWAPCCIGPYSQATSIGKLTFVAGQLGLEPLSMGFEGISPSEEFDNALRHCQSVAISVGSDFRKMTVRVIIYLANDFLSGLLDSDQRPLLERVLQFFGQSEDGSQKKFTATLEPYLKPPDVDFGIPPIVTFVSIPTLPKAARIEIQPILINDWTSYASPQDGMDEDREPDSPLPQYVQTHEWDNPWLQGNLYRSNRAMASTRTGGFADATVLIHQSLFRVGQFSTSDVDPGAIKDLCRQFLDRFHSSDRLTDTMFTYLTIWYRRDRIDEAAATGLSVTLTAAFEGVSCVCYPCRQIGVDSRLDRTLVIDTVTLDSCR